MIDQKRGRLIVFEGVEGAGKSTQLDRLVAQLARAGIFRTRNFGNPAARSSATPSARCCSIRQRQ